MSLPDPLEVLYDEHAPALFRFLVRLTRDEAMVKDIFKLRSQTEFGNEGIGKLILRFRSG